MFNSLTTFNLSDKFNSFKSSLSTLYSEQFTSQVQWFNISDYFKQKRTRQEVIDKVQRDFVMSVSRLIRASQRSSRDLI